MTSADWIAAALPNRRTLVALVTEFHPLRTNDEHVNADLPITALRVELARLNVVRGIRQTTEGDPVKEFTAALDAGDANRAYTLLDQTWFGVPESTSCWNIEGFSDAVRLLEDPPDDSVGGRDDEAAQDAS